MTFVEVPGGAFAMGDDGPLAYPADGESPRRQTTVATFSIATMAVTNAEFAAFVDTTGYVTEAQRFGWSFVFVGLLPADFPPTRAVASSPWWRQVHGAAWHRPEGPHSSLDGREHHPVAHVTYADALAYVRWAGLRLPTEAEWEYASRAGTDTTFPWGTELEPDGVHVCNVFQGSFPDHDTGADGWAGTCPVDTYAPNAFGLHNTIGNVWEWTADVFTIDRPASAADGPDAPRVLKGGSYLCHHSYCHRYRPGARVASTPDSSSGNTGFRCAL